MAREKRMRQTMVRFGEDLRTALERKAERLGIGVGQDVRDAAPQRHPATT
jgi:hypothetical protein